MFHSFAVHSMLYPQEVTHAKNILEAPFSESLEFFLIFISISVLSSWAYQSLFFDTVDIQIIGWIALISVLLYFTVIGLVFWSHEGCVVIGFAYSYLMTKRLNFE